MADDNLPAVIPSEIVEGVIVQTTVHRQVTDMTPEASRTYVECAERQFAVPAREATRRVGIETVGRLALGGGLTIAACVCLSGGPLAWVLIAIAGVFGSKPLIEAIKKKPE